MSITEEQGHGRPCIAGKLPKKKLPPKALPPAVQHHRDREEDDDGGAPRLPVFVRFNDLVTANIVRNWTTLLRLIREEGFPTGIMIGAHTRAWPLREVEAWLARRPIANNDIRLRGKRAQVEAES